jgi:ketosteroid isomerase-like protein
VQPLSQLASVDAALLRGWLECFANAVRARDPSAAAQLFRPRVIGFGSVARSTTSLEELQSQQWATIWPRSTGFAFEADPWVALSGDGCTVVIAAQWTSTGYHADGQQFERPGRCSLVLLRASRDATWLAAHSHFSLVPGTPPVTFEPR